MNLWLALAFGTLLGGPAQSGSVKPVIMKGAPARVNPIGAPIPRATWVKPSASLPLLQSPLAVPRVSVQSVPSIIPIPAAAALPAVEVPSTRGLLEEQARRIEESAAKDHSGAGVSEGVRELYHGRSSHAGHAGAASAGVSGGSVVNDEGVRVFGRAAAYYREIRSVVERLKTRIDLSESLDVMDDTYGEVLGKIKAIEAVAMSRGVEQENTHLEQTLTWVDGVLRKGGKNVAVHTHRVYFHRAKNPRSEIEEGIRRVDGYIRQSINYFKRGGKAEAALGRLDEVDLVFDTRGYKEIKRHIESRRAQVERESRGRIRFSYLDELTRMPETLEETRAGFDALVGKYKGQGLEKIIEGVTYSRYVGLLLELKTLEHYLDQGYTILQSGRELFDREGLYVTELDTVVRSPQGKVLLVEAKSARVKLPFEEVLRDKVARKLAVYQRFRALLDAAVGSRIDGIVFAMDMGPNEGLAAFLEGKRGELSRRYGFPVSFLFIESSPAQE